MLKERREVSDEGGGCKVLTYLQSCFSYRNVPYYYNNRAINAMIIIVKLTKQFSEQS